MILPQNGEIFHFFPLLSIQLRLKARLFAFLGERASLSYWWQIYGEALTKKTIHFNITSHPPGTIIVFLLLSGEWILYFALLCQVLDTYTIRCETALTRTGMKVVSQRCSDEDVSCCRAKFAICHSNGAGVLSKFVAVEINVKILFRCNISIRKHSH